ncbi:hypothetical protein K490DRAFT_55125 [Saccharata proteae CBS 121410]|uniref:Zn(2)-C6 fungal-type domain-containing protein n=1 Tax=Saccharata proteae CBS 121410 TaxID=1314787 RepID=A0A6A5YFG0_9PEZI|nr:hypothetical protein K490DRAFT_55125 [Saccharata proteae CBS 121410]
MAQLVRPSRQTRSSAACDECRSRKQKCGGEWPVCARCRESGNPCVWPQQLQRGPAKGYLEAIEARLDQVENLLSQVLPLVPQEHLTDALSSRGDSPTSSADGKTKRTTQEKKAAQDYWAAFPLNSPEGVLSWHQDHQRRTAAQPGGSGESGKVKEIAQPPAVNVPSAILSNAALSHPVNQHQEQSSTVATPTWPAQQTPMTCPGLRLEPSPNLSQTPGQPGSDSQSGQFLSPKPDPKRTTTANGNGIGLTAGFQAKFLW